MTYPSVMSFEAFSLPDGLLIFKSDVTSHRARMCGCINAKGDSWLEAIATYDIDSVHAISNASDDAGNDDLNLFG